MADMTPQDLAAWLRETSAINAMSDKDFDDQGGSTFAPGDNARGYRVMYEIEQSSGEKVYVSPLVARNATPSLAALANAWEDRDSSVEYQEALFGKGVHKASEDYSVHSADGSQDVSGYYYFETEEAAKNYMKAIVFGVKTGGSNQVAPISDYSAQVWGDRKRAKVRLGLFEVEGVAQAKPWDEGSIMDEMTINPEPILALSPEVIGVVQKNYSGIAAAFKGNIPEESKITEGLKDVYKNNPEWFKSTYLATSLIADSSSAKAQEDLEKFRAAARELGL